jgi:ABC-2 type transport system ATP-binding protein
MSEWAIQIKSLSFSYKNQNLFSQLNLDLSPNQMVALIGTNGSGKSTLIQLILGLLHPTAGVIEVFGFSPQHKQCRTLVGAALQDVDFPGSETVTDVLHFVSQQYQVSESIDQLVDDFFLREFAHKSCYQLSGGMKRRLALACAFIGQPRLLLLDEPGTGLDVDSRHRLIKNLKKYQQKNQALVLMISHHPEEVIEDVHQFLHLKQGQISSLSPQRMTELTRLRRVEFHSPKDFPWPEAIRSQHQNGQHWFVCPDSDALIKELVKQDWPFNSLNVRHLGSDEILKDIL